ncbi:uncharacterized protein [Chelonus insularis]|uniref:uncharacterized protein n=1 Tax=Chelonus insularis TaxID=460826 RepID=UPI00158899CA|nr:uncharacterized protein LOC118069104 [Chelonus insularis]
MRLLWFVFLVSCMRIAAAFDLGPLIRIAQCRIQCLKKHSADGTCDWYYNRGESVCSECWQNCESLETQWEATKFICEGDEYLRCPACQTACLYRKTRVEEEYLPSSLPAPAKGPIKIGQHDIAILLRKASNVWKEYGYYPGTRVPLLRADTWIVAVLEDGIKHFSWEEWTPTLESLKEGPLVEATLSWRDVDIQIQRQRELEQKKFNDRVRQFYLEKYGEKVLVEWRDSQDSPIPEEVFRRFFFKRRSEGEDINSGDLSNSFKQNKFLEASDGEGESYVVSWEPETGGLMGNQVVDTRSAQISLLPGTKYLVRIASNDGPGSFPIEIDTRPTSVHVWKIKKNFENIQPMAILSAAACAFIVIFIVILMKLVLRSKSKEFNEENV